jgi:deoxyribodipyrimidine photo-lyase
MADQTSVSPQAVRGGETVARKRLHDFLQSGIEQYAAENNSLGADATSRLSAYLHFGCLSVREIETMLPDTEGARAWHRQLAWREFYHYVLFHFPHPEREFQERYRAYPWEKNAKLLNAWKEGRTGYPVVDAAMRQLKAEGWMHNRGRLIVGSFLTKDLGIDWREGERYFMQWLIDGDMANNNGNWQWIASVGVDPAPVFRRLYNPSSQRDTYDPSGSYVRTYVPELKNVPDEYLSEPWKMSKEAQESYRCIIGKDYPAPVVDHKEARQLALERFRSL